MSLPEGVRMRFDHLSIAVESIDDAYDFFAKYFPITPRSEKTPSDQVSGTFYWSDFYLGGFALELIEDLPDQPGFVGKFIRKHGQGFHHLSIEVNRLGPIIEQLRADGVRVVDEQEFESGSMTAFVSPRSAFGALIQFWQVPDYDAEHPQPPKDERAYFDHVALAVKDIDQAVAFFQRYFPTRMLRPKRISGSSRNYMLAQLEVAGLKLEFIQRAPQPEDDFVARFLQKHGEGIHHMSVYLRDFDATLARLRSDGVRVVDQRTDRHGRRQFFISPHSAFGTLIQVWEGR